MFKFKFLFLFLFLMCLNLSAVNFLSYEKGVKLGVNLSGISTGESNFEGLEFGDSVESRYGFALGGFIMIPIKPNMDIQVELLFNQKGYLFEHVINPSFKVEHDLRASYIEIPVLFNYKLKEVFNLYAGAYLSVLIHSDVNIEGPASSTSPEKLEGPAEDSLSTFDLGVTLGASFKYKKFFVDLRLSRGIMDINLRGLLGKSHIQENTYNQQLLLFLGYTL